MTKHSGKHNYNISAKTPIAKQLEALFETIPEDDLLKSIKTYYAGRYGYGHRILWRTYIVMVVLNLPSFAALIRALENNPCLANACGIQNPDLIPSKFAYSRFISKFKVAKNVILVKGIMRNLTRQCYKTFPEFGKSVAIDATDLKAWANGRKAEKVDPDAGWVVKPDTAGKLKYVWGYKMHLMVDAKYEIPITASITRGNMHDVKQATPLLSQARFITGKFHPDYVLCDAGYCSKNLRRAIKRQFRAQPIIKARKNQRTLVEQETPEWKAIYNQRTSVERVFGRMKDHKRLNNITVRRIRKVTVHSLLAVIVTQAMALAFPQSPRQCAC